MFRKAIVFAFIGVGIIGITLLELTGGTEVSSTVVAQVKDHLASQGYTAVLPSSNNLPSGSSDTRTYCKWEFSHYESSAYENEWFEIIGQAQHHICKTVQEARHEEASKHIVSRVEELSAIDSKITWPTVDSELPSVPDVRDGFMSKMHYSHTCYDPSTDKFVKSAEGKGVQLIEPLWGMLRDPFDIFCEELKLTMDSWDSKHESQSKEHIMAQGFAPYAYDKMATSAEQLTVWRNHGTPPWYKSLRPVMDKEMGLTFTQPKNVHLDLGSSYFGGWTLGGGTESSASGQWFYDHYHQRGQKFDAFIAVELERLDPATAFKQVPTDLIGKYNLINTGLTMDKGDKFNTLDMIKRTVSPDDFFVLKLDIDSAPIEEPIVQSLLHDDPANGGASALIDELMVSLVCMARIPRTDAHSSNTTSSFCQCPPTGVLPMSLLTRLAASKTPISSSETCVRRESGHTAGLELAVGNMHECIAHLLRLPIVRLRTYTLSISSSIPARHRNIDTRAIEVGPPYQDPLLLRRVSFADLYLCHLSSTCCEHLALTFLSIILKNQMGVTAAIEATIRT